jgi:hypothetical protein
MRQDIPNFRPVMLQRGSAEFSTMHLGGAVAWSQTPPDGARKAPLGGGRVLDLTHVLAGPWATYLPADFGTEVIKFERQASAMTPADGGRRTQHSGVKADIGAVLAEQKCC